jgi:hypothetical protein
MNADAVNRHERRSIGAEPEKIRRLGWRDFAIRFAFGAAISLVAALAGQLLGNRVGGELLAFPAILPATLTLIEAKEDRRKAESDTRGAILGGFGLVAFALVGLAGLIQFRLSALASLGLALLAWVAVAAGLFMLIYGSRPRD